jgi:N-acetylmuramoyl-L-alanine amidase
MRKKTDLIVVHCAATTPEMDIGVKEIDKWHRDRGWKGCGYHIVIRRNGVREIGRHIDAVGAHVEGYNAVSVGVCLVGGINKQGKAENNFTKEQYEALWEVIQILKNQFPKAEVVGHRDLNAGKECPSFDVKRWYAEKMMEN